MRKLLPAAIIGAAVGLGVSPALAHAFGDRYDLPIPLNFFLVGGEIGRASCRERV